MLYVVVRGENILNPDVEVGCFLFDENFFVFCSTGQNIRIVMLKIKVLPLHFGHTFLCWVLKLQLNRLVCFWLWMVVAWSASCHGRTHVAQFGEIRV